MSLDLILENEKCISDLENLSLLFEKDFREGTYPANLLGGVSDVSYFVKKLTPVKRVLKRAPQIF